MSFRELPPVAENIEPRDKASQTLLARMAVCPRSAYLYVRHDGGAPSHAMHRGSAFHEFAAMATRWLVDADEPRLPWEVGKDLMAEVVAAHPEWVIPPDEMDVLRIAAFHWCDVTVLDPESVLAVEKLFELQVGPLRVRGKVDLALALGSTLGVRDYKTFAYVPGQEDFDEQIQQPLYALLVADGRPIKQERCRECEGAGELLWVTPNPGDQSQRISPGDVVHVRDPERAMIHADECEACDGGWVETPEAPIGARFGSFETMEQYPRLEPWDEGTGKVLAHRERSFDRMELVDQRLYVAGLVSKFEHGLATGEWPAVPGSHCATCPAPHECPIPPEHRERMGALQTLEDAIAEAAALVVEQNALTGRRAALRAFSKGRGGISIPAGTDLEFRWQDEETEEWITGKKIGRPTTADAKAAMLEAIRTAVETGARFRYEDFRRTRHSSKFDKRRVERASAGAAHDTTVPPAPAEPDREARLDDLYGKDAPF